MKKLIIISLGLFTLLILFTFHKCNYGNQPDKILEQTNKPTFNNPYAWVGEGHNWVMDKFNSKEVDFSLKNSFELTKRFMREKGMKFEDFDSQRMIDKTDNLLKLSLPGFPDSIDNNKREMSLEEIVSHLFNENWISEKTKINLIEIAKIIEGYIDAREKLADYCNNLDESIDDTTRTMIYAIESIYRSSYDWWSSRGFGKINKVTLPILAKADIAGGAVAGGIYAGQCLLDPNCQFSWGGLLGGMVAGAAGASFFKKIGWW